MACRAWPGLPPPCPASAGIAQGPRYALLHLPQVNHLSEGVKLGLRDDREKRSEALGRWGQYCSWVAALCLRKRCWAWLPGSGCPLLPGQLGRQPSFMPDFRSPKPRFPRRNVMFHGDSRISSLPPYLTIQVGAGGNWLV